MPLDELPAAVKKTACDALVLSGVIEPEENVFKSQLPALVDKLDVPVFLGGSVVATRFDELKRSGAHLIGTDIETGIRQIAKVLSSTDDE